MFSNLFDFIMVNWLEILVLTIFFTILQILWRRNKRPLVKKIILGLVVEAEKKLGSGTGALKYALVISKIYEALPFTIRFFFSKDDIHEFIESAVDYMKELLKDGEIDLLGYDSEVIDSMYNFETFEVLEE